MSARRREIVRQYFRYVDAGDGRIMDLYTDDVELLFPKFGRTRGKEAMRRFGARMGAMLGKLEHDIDALAFVEAGDTIVVEGREWGEMADGTPFPDGDISQGLFCNVFEFEGELIKAVRVYVDPDFTSADQSTIRALR
ncbi:nuclear transport factor 2 family protein [Aurantiacibacter xanthus]|uniref:Nuclear transport factor 2 family protein n=1 Tax=Aurantiacibacter xanthus TaxID=1784712 RepID=A0A3A1P705_9SPHN|nr:nuclear transport factor 2 family protein [Aurantiacibacter xanthus]